MRELKMINISKLYEKFIKNPLDCDIFDLVENETIQIIDTNNSNKTIIIKRSIKNNLINESVFGYYFLRFFDECVKEQDLKIFLEDYRQFVINNSNYNYKDVEPILVAKSFDLLVKSFSNQYNEFQKRKNIELILVE